MVGLLGVRVVDFTSQIAGPYCTKLFADAGADIIKVETTHGDPLRTWTASGEDLGGCDSPLFRFLNASKRSVVGELGDKAIGDLIAQADLVVEDFGPDATIDRDALLRANPALVLLSISPFGLTGPYATRPATEFTIQAEAASTGGRGLPGREPFQAGGRVTEWVSGTFAAAGALAAVRGAQRTGRGEHIDFSIQACMCMSSTVFIDLMWSLLEIEKDESSGQSSESPSIEPSKDGYVGFNTNTAQQFSDFLLLIERPDLRETGEFDSAMQRAARLDEWQTILRTWTREHTTADIIEQARLFRIPVAQVGNGRSVLEHEQLVARGIYVDSPADPNAPSFKAPQPPYRIDGERPPAPRPAPRLGEHSGDAAFQGDARTRRGQEKPSLPLAGVRVVDATTWWAGPSATHALAALGADVIHVESIQRIDGGRTLGGMLVGKYDDWWEAGNIFLAANTNKRDVTADLSSPRGREILNRLIATADIFVENFSPRVMEGFGIDWKHVQALNPRCIMVRMPAFGLDGPWRDNVGFAQTMEQLSGMAWLTGHPDDQPRIQRGPCDPLAGMHATFAMLVALAERDKSGRGHFVECGMVEGALNVAAEQVIEFTAHGHLQERMGNRCPEAAPQGLYPCADHDTQNHPRWLALSIANDEQWSALLEWLGNPSWSTALAQANAAERHAAHDKIDEHLRKAFSDRDRDECIDALIAIGVPAASLTNPRWTAHHPQLLDRGFYESVDHPVVGTHPIATLPYRFASVDQWIRSGAPVLGAHNREVLLEVGYDADEIDGLEADSIIGSRPEGV